MAEDRVRVKINLEKLKQFGPRTRELFYDGLKNNLSDLILREIRAGKSVVKGEGRFVKYSDSYTLQILAGNVSSSKRIRPVNLTVTGALLDSLQLMDRKEVFTATFTDKKAYYHNVTGPGGHTEAIRRMLPTKPGEEFSPSITARLMALVRAGLRISIAEQNGG